MKVVLDTNIIISSYATRGLCHSVFESCLDRFEIVISPALIEEIRTDLEKKLKLPKIIIKEVLDYLCEHATSLETKKLLSGACRDPEDDHILDLADSSKSKFLITGDEDLLILKKYGRTQIVTPRQVWQLLKKQDNELLPSILGFLAKKKFRFSLIYSGSTSG